MQMSRVAPCPMMARAAKDVGEQARPLLNDVNSKQPQRGASSCSSFPQWTTPTTTPSIPAAPAHGHLRRNTIAPHSDRLQAATSPRLRCLRRRHHTARTPSNMDTWATTPNIIAQVLPQQRTANPTQLRSSSNNSTSTSRVRMRRSCLSTQMLSSKVRSQASSLSDTTEPVLSASSSITSSRLRSRDSSATARRTL